MRAAEHYSKKIWSSTHPRNFGNHMPFNARPPAHSTDRPSAPQAYQCKAKTTKESIKTKTESGKCFCICVVTSTNLEYSAWERQRKRENRRQASETQREKGQQRSRARDKKRRRLIFCWKNNMKFFSGSEKWEILAATNAKWKWAGAQKKLKENTLSLLKSFFR